MTALVSAARLLHHMEGQRMTRREREALKAADVPKVPRPSIADVIATRERTGVSLSAAIEWHTGRRPRYRVEMEAYA